MSQFNQNWRDTLMPLNSKIKDAIKNTPSPNAPTNDFSKLVYDFFIDAKKTQNM